MNKQLEEQIENQNYEQLYKHRDFLDGIRIKCSDSYDKYMLTFATGSLYLSINFTNSLSQDLIKDYLLKIGWIALLITIFSTIISFIVSEKAHKRQMNITDSKIEALSDDKLIVNVENCWNKFVTVLKFITLSFFIIGISVLTFFYFVNLTFNV